MFRKVISRACQQLPRGSNLRSFTDEVAATDRVEKSLNQVMLLGRVGSAPQLRGNKEHPVVIFSLATHVNYKYESGEYMQRTDWHRVCVFKPSLRDNVYNFLKKGQRVLVNGRLTYGEVKDEDGSTKATTSVVAEDVVFFQT